MLQGDGTNAVLAAGQALELDQQHDFVRFRGGRSPRQQRLDKLLAYYDCEQYAARSVAWDGTKFVGQFERDTIALAGYVPPGFYVANSQTIPISFRRPTTPYNLVRVIVDRFTSLLFSDRRHPRAVAEADADSDALIGAIIEEGHLWPMFMQVRMFGGATGSGIVGFKFIDGRPYFEVFDPRWSTPSWADRPNLILKSLEYRYPFTQEIQNRENGRWEEHEFWYRRVIDLKSDIIYQPEKIDEDENGQMREPRWKEATRVDHNFGFCPVVWIQNTPNPTDIDGTPDCVGIYEMAEAIDRISSQSERALLANLDPTLVIATDAQMGEVRKGSDHALKLGKGDDAKYLEISASGVKAAEDKIATYRKQALEVAQCVLDQPDTTAKTATEIEREYSSMTSKADVLRHQYGELGVKRLLSMVIVVIKRITAPRQGANGIVRASLRLPVKENGAEHKLGPGPYRISMKWPSYFDPSPDDTAKATNAAVLAKGGGLIDHETAIRYIAEFFGIDDVKAILAKVKAEKTSDQAALEAEALRGPKAVAKEMINSGQSDDED